MIVQARVVALLFGTALLLPVVAQAQTEAPSGAESAASAPTRPPAAPSATAPVEAPSAGPPNEVAPAPTPAPGNIATSMVDTARATPTPSAATAPAERVPTFDAEAFGAASDPSALTLKMYGDTLFQVRNHAPVHDTFAAAHLDLFGQADVDRLSFLTEIFFEPENNEISLDVERLQVSYLFSNWLRLRMGRTHTAFGYYNDTYHHGNLFELTTERPYAVEFEDSGGLFSAHLVGVAADGAFDIARAGQIHYDLEVGNGRTADTTQVALEEAGKDMKLVNLRLRWLPTDALIVGVNGLYDEIPPLDVPAAGSVPRPKIHELICGLHFVYLNHGVHALMETYAVRHASVAVTRSTYGGFLELGYALGQFTPYFRPELIRFPKYGDQLYQEDVSPYSGVRTFVDYRLGGNWQPVPQLALKLEAEHLERGVNRQELVTFKVAFGF